MGWTDIQERCKNRVLIFSSNARSRKIRKNIPCLVPAQQSILIDDAWDEKRTTKAACNTESLLWPSARILETENILPEISIPPQNDISLDSQTENTSLRSKRKSTQLGSEGVDEILETPTPKYLKRCSAPVDITKTAEILGRRDLKKGRSLEQIRQCTDANIDGKYILI
jgi:hypothetical protein